MTCILSWLFHVPFFQIKGVIFFILCFRGQNTFVVFICIFSEVTVISRLLSNNGVLSWDNDEKHSPALDTARIDVSCAFNIKLQEEPGCVLSWTFQGSWREQVVEKTSFELSSPESPEPAVPASPIYLVGPTWVLTAAWYVLDGMRNLTCRFWLLPFCGAGVKVFVSAGLLCWSWSLHPPWCATACSPAPAAPYPGEAPPSQVHSSCKQGYHLYLPPLWVETQKHLVAILLGPASGVLWELLQVLLGPCCYTSIAEYLYPVMGRVSSPQLCSLLNQ